VFALAACSGSDGADEVRTVEPTAVTLPPLDDVVVTVAPDDFSGDVVVIDETADEAAETTPPTTAVPISIDPVLEDAGVEPEPVEQEINPLGGDDPEDGLMPDVVCMSLQDAQDEIQDHGVFFSKSVDATGEGRRQFWDRNWTVVAQSPEPGVEIGENEAVLSVVKNDEDSDC